MNLGNLKIMARAYVPSAKAAKVPDTVVGLILQEGADVVAALTRCLPTSDTFNVVAEQGVYDLNNELERYLIADKGGLWWLNGTEWEQLDPKTEEEMNEKFPSWRSDSSGDPQRYFIKGSNLTVHPKPETAVDNGFKFYFGQRPPRMTSDAHFPFGGGVENVQLSLLSECVLMYWTWKCRPVIGEKETMQIDDPSFYRDVKTRWSVLNQNPAYDKNAKFGGRRIASTL